MLSRRVRWSGRLNGRGARREGYCAETGFAKKEKCLTGNAVEFSGVHRYSCGTSFARSSPLFYHSLWFRPMPLQSSLVIVVALVLLMGCAPVPASSPVAPSLSSTLDTGIVAPAPPPIPEAPKPATVAHHGPIMCKSFLASHEPPTPFSAQAAKAMSNLMGITPDQAAVMLNKTKDDLDDGQRKACMNPKCGSIVHSEVTYPSDTAGAQVKVRCRNKRGREITLSYPIAALN